MPTTRFKLPKRNVEKWTFQPVTFVQLIDLLAASNHTKIDTMKTPYHPPIDSIPFTRVLHALSEPNRLKIIRCLHENIENNCTAYTIKLDLPKSTVSHHIKVLREAGLIQARIDGKEHYYSLRKEEVENRFPGLLSAVVNVKEEDL